MRYTVPTGAPLLHARRLQGGVQPPIWQQPAAHANKWMLARESRVAGWVGGSGPWQGLWARRGYDPRLDDSARRWQALHYATPSSWYHHTAEGTQALSHADVAPSVATSMAQVYRSAPPLSGRGWVGSDVCLISRAICAMAAVRQSGMSCSPLAPFLHAPRCPAASMHPAAVVATCKISSQLQ